MDRLLSHAARLCSLTPSGHKFTLVARRYLIGTDEIWRLENAILAWTPHRFRNDRDQCCVQPLGLVSAGVQIGTTPFVVDDMTRTLAKLEPTVHQVAAMPNTQVISLISRYCLIVRLHYWLQCCMLRVPTTISSKIA